MLKSYHPEYLGSDLFIIIMTSLLQQLFSGDEIYVIPDLQKITVEKIVVEEKKVEHKIAQIAEETQEDASLTLSTSPLTHPTLILVNKPSAENMELLDKILKSVHLVLEDVELLDLAKLKGENIKEILLQKHVKQIITFGVPLTKLNLQILLTPYQIREADGVRFLYADTFAELATDVARKKMLWGCLKALFN